MKLVGAVFLLLFPELLTYHQSDYIGITERVEVASYDKVNMKFAKTKNFRFNRTHTGINFTLHLGRDFGYNLETTVQAYKFSSNEYRFFPMTFGFNLCNYLMTDTFGIANIYNCGNFPKCPLVKGNYIICNWAPDYPKFPPYIPGGRYKSDIKFVYNSEEILHLEAYAEIKPKNKWELMN